MRQRKPHVLKRIHKKQAKKEGRVKTVVVENIELMSKDQKKKLAKQPTNNIRVSGKRKRKMLKRLRHAEKSKNQMEVEVQQVGRTQPQQGTSTEAATEGAAMESDS
ncbi:uncharacterized protein LOC127844296 [Dreissena polymorpha]|uniref:Uncharacterized protein n=1 Tax=Dreissena polymorpha TaxID=45954 RepID=A0A9D4INM0_DREPO|nr:uncharacterized protein LOC127844296 [Dreissena polymorpha]KAH3778113.1 hypothetical protein DPMN_179566 [Dreissena polymorpha]